MTQGAQILTVPRRVWSAQKASFAWRSVLLGGLLVLLYYQVLAKLVSDWWNLPDFSHGFLVPVFAAYLVWTKRKILVATRRAPSWSGVAVVFAGLVLLIGGVYGAELFLSRVSLIVLLAGIVLTFGGLNLLKELRFALLVLLLAIPIPTILFTQITFPLQMLASKLERPAAPVWCPCLPRRQHHQPAYDEPGGGGGMQRDSISHELVHSGGVLRVLLGEVELEEGGARRRQRAYRHYRQRLPNFGYGALRAVLEPR